MKKKYGAWLGAFLLILAICTYASTQIYRRSLPMVQTVETISTKLNFVWELTGNLHYDQTAMYSVPVPATIVQSQVRAGDRVTVGQPLLQVDTEQLHLQWLQCKIDEESLEARIKKSKSFTKEQLELQLIQLQETILFIENLMEADGWIIADTDGIVLRLQQSQQAAAQVPLITVGPDNGQKTLEFLLSEVQAAYCKPDTELEVTLICDGKSVVVNVAADRVIYSAEKNGYLCMATTDLAVDMMDGQKLAATLAAESVFYYYVLPIEAVVANNNSNASFYVLRERETIMGTEYYTVMRTGYIREQNESYVALASAVMEPVVISTSDTIYDGCIVSMIS